jgi:rubrerythrin
MVGFFFRKQYHQLETNARRTDNLIERTRELEAAVEGLQNRLEELGVQQLALQRILAERTPFTPKEWQQALEAARLDREREVLGTFGSCRKCGKTLSHSHATCMYCGHPKETTAPPGRSS